MTERSSAVSSPTCASIATCAREPARSSAARRRSNGKLTVNARSSSAGPSPNRPCHNGCPVASPAVLIGPLPGLGGATTFRLTGPTGARSRPSQRVGTVFGVVRREVVVVEAAHRAPARGVTPTRFEPQPYFAGYVALGLFDERGERPHQRRVPQPVVYEFCDPDLDALLLARDVTFEGDAFEILVRRDERERRRALVDLAALDADAPVLDHVDAAPPVGADRGAELVDERHEIELLAVEAHRDARVEADDNVARLRGRVLGVASERVRLLRRRGPRVLEHAALDGAAPHVFVDRVELLDGRFDRDLPLRGEIDALGPRQSPLPCRREHLEVGGEDPGRHFEPDLVVALARAAVADGVGAVAAGRGDEMLDDDGARQRRHERILALIERVGAQRGHEDVLGEVGARVDDLDLDRTGGAGTLADGFVLPRNELADVDRAAHHLDAPVLAHPAHCDRRVQSTRVGEHNSLRHVVPFLPCVDSP